MSKKFSFIVFDWNGTIVNDVSLCYELLNKMLIECHHEPVSFNRYRDIFTFPIIKYYEEAGFSFSPNGTDSFLDLANEFREDYENKFPSLPLFDDVLDVLNALKKDYPIYLVSATKKNLLLEEVNEKKLSKYFDGISGIEDIFGASKEESAKHFFLSHNLDPKDALFVGDTLHDEEVSSIFGASCALISRGHQSLKVLEKGKKEETYLFSSLTNLYNSLFKVEK